MRPMETLGSHRQEKGDQHAKKDRMGESPVCYQLLGWPQPGHTDEIDVRDTLRQGAPEHGFLPELFICEEFTYAGAEGDMGQSIHE